MQQGQKRAEFLAPLKARVANHIGTRVTDESAVQLALACAMRDREDLVGFLFPKNVATTALRKSAEIAITPAEWDGLFGRQSTALKDGGVAQLVGSADFAPAQERMSEALRCTIAERDQGVLYQRAWTKALCHIGMHFEDSDAPLEATLGSIVRADARRLEELRELLDDDAHYGRSDTMLMGQLVIAVAKSVV